MTKRPASSAACATRCRVRSGYNVRSATAGLVSPARTSRRIRLRSFVMCAATRHDVFRQDVFPVIFSAFSFMVPGETSGDFLLFREARYLDIF